MPTGKPTQIVKLSPPHPSLPKQLQAFNIRGVEEERTLYSDTRCHPADREAGACSCGAHPDNYPLKRLDPLPVTLLDLYIHSDSIAGLERRDL